MLCNKIIKKLFLGLFIIPFLISCAPKSSQLFIFRSFENGQYVYYESDIYNPSKTQKLDTPPCNTNPRYFTPSWSLNGKHYVCSALVDQPLFIKDSNNVITAKLEPGDPNDSILWSFGSWSPNSQYITVNGKHSEDLFIMKYDGANFLQLVRSSNAAVGQSQWSPNGKYIAYQYFPFANDNDYLTTIDTTGRETHRFDLQKLTNGASPYGFNWSPDSKKLTFLGSSYLDDGWYILDIESGRISSVILKGIICGWNLPEWSPNGQQFLIVAHDCKTYTWGDLSADRIYTINSDGSNLKSLTDKSVGNAHWSPDGKFIIFDKYTNQGSEIFIMNADGTNQRNLFGNQSHLSFIQWITP